ncbi:histidine phosphatase family protein [Lichenicoccus roseus]|uniref:Histidine phosphatase family protein n=1 Tax=Lichenicoccus roseus TaxID=2683649 RepID=A0A5R9J5X0_9PROT|nr:histidine phosphatase family protein [Lichenicoccus roseus]
MLRHAKALAAAPGAPDDWDHARPLADRGLMDAAAMGRLLRERGWRPEQALVSTAARARQTYAQLGLQPPDGSTAAAFHDHLYLAEPDSLLDALREAPADADSVLLVGHNPGLHELAYRLSGEADALQRGFPTCMLAIFAVEGCWSTLDARHARLLDVVAP